MKTYPVDASGGVDRLRGVLFAPWWLYAAAGLALVWLAATLYVFRMLGIMDILLGIWAVLMLAKATVWVGRNNVWAVSWYGLRWRRIPLAKIEEVTYAPRELWGKLRAGQLVLSTGKWSLVDIPMGSIAASHAAGSYIRGRIEALRNGTPPPGPKQTGGRGFRLPAGVLPWWYRWRGPVVALFFLYLALNMTLLALAIHFGHVPPPPPP